MADPRFFTVAGPYTLAKLAEITGAQLADPASAPRTVTDVAPLQDADENKLCFLDNRKYLDAFKVTKAGACIVRPELAEFAPKSTACLTHKNPYKAYALAAQAFYPAAKVTEFRAPSAVIDATAVIGKDSHIGHGAVIGKYVKIGARCRIQPNAVIESGVEIGDDCDIGAGSYITHALIGPRVRLYPGVCIGRPGFGFAIDPAGFVSVPQLGRVIIESDVEIGAGTTIDRGAGPDTVIGMGTRIDNLVQIGHNVKIGKACIIVALAGISGSTEIGDFTMIGGQAGLAGHLKVGPGTKISAQAGVMRDLPPKSEVMGSPAIPSRQFMRQVALLSKMCDKKAGGGE